MRYVLDDKDLNEEQRLALRDAVWNAVRGEITILVRKEDATVKRLNNASWLQHLKEEE